MAPCVREYVEIKKKKVERGELGRVRLLLLFCLFFSIFFAVSALLARVRFSFLFLKNSNLSLVTRTLHVTQGKSQGK